MPTWGGAREIGSIFYTTVLAAATLTAAYANSLGRTVRVGPNFVAINGIGDVKKVYNTQETFPKSPFYNTFESPSLPRNIFSTSNVVFHCRYRRPLGGAMSESSLKSMIPELQRRAEMAMDSIATEIETRGAADINKWSLFFTSDVIGDLTFGEGFNMLESSVQNQYSKDLHRASKTVGVSTQLPALVKYARYLPFEPKAIQDIRLAVLRMVTYAKHQGSDDDLMTEDELISNALTYLVTSTDTTSNTLTYLVWAISENDTIRARLVDELAALPTDFCDTDLKTLPYLGCVIQEALRLFSSAPAPLPRVVPRAGAVLGGYQLDASTEVATQAYSMHRNAHVFEDPYCSNPARLENETRDMKDSMTAFGRGNRACIGMHLAIMEIRLITAHFYRRFPNAKISAIESMSRTDMEPAMIFLASPSGSRCLMEA
ncbi:hypothetical protein PWT90_09911 [Aphanocladium album]|nr:hypothetical protein PWT90_09911 [Aphanocladium album]